MAHMHTVWVLGSILKKCLKTQAFAHPRFEEHIEKEGYEKYEKECWSDTEFFQQKAQATQIQYARFFKQFDDFLEKLKGYLEKSFKHDNFVLKLSLNVMV